MTARPPGDGSQPCATTDPEIWFPEVGGSPRIAKALCGRCDFTAACLAYALSTPHELAGVFGGTTEHERRVLRRKGMAA